MKKKFTFLLTALLLLFGSARAAVTDVPEMSSGDNIKWYTISNTRSTSGRYLYWTENGVKDANTLNGTSLFYFTGEENACNIHNAATELLFSGAGAWTAEGVSCKISETPHSSKAGLAIEFSGTALNEQNYANGFTTWSANDEGSIFVISPATASIQEAVALIEENQAAGNTISGQYRYEKESYDELVAALTAFNTATSSAEAMEAFETCLSIINELPIAMPEAGKFYVIECPIFFNAQGVSKGLYATTDGNMGWNTIELKNEQYYWTVEENNGTYALKNLQTGTYLNGTSMSSNAAYSTLTPLGEKQFNITVNGVIVHAEGHSAGTGTSGNIVNWSAGLNSASSWKFIERVDPATLVDVVVRYEFTYNEEVKYTQEVNTFIGEEYPDINTEFAYGVVPAESKPEGVTSNTDVVDGKITKQIPLTFDLPFVVATDINSITNWYYLKMHSTYYKFIEYLEGESYIEWVDSDVNLDNLENYAWAFIGNPFDGFKVVNRAATTAMALTSTGSGDAMMGNYADATAFIYAKTEKTDQVGGFCLKHPTANQYINAQSGRLAHWSAADAGSTIIAMDVTSYIAAQKESALSTLTSLAELPVFANRELIETAISDIEALDDTDPASVAKFSEELAKVITDIESKCYYFQNSNTTDAARSNVYLATDMSDSKGRGNKAFDYNAVWSLKHYSEASFYLYNPLNQVYLGTPQSEGALTSAPASAYTFEFVNGTLAELKSNTGTLHVHNWADCTLTNWDQDETASRWYVSYYATTEELEALLSGNAWKVIPAAYEAGIKNAESEKHVIDDVLTIYTSYCHWSDELTIFNSPYKGGFYSNELPSAIKSISFDVTCDKEETLLVYGSNDGATWTLVDEVNVSNKETVADFTGTAYNYFKVETKGFNEVHIANMTIIMDPTVELPLIVDEPAFNVAGGNLYESIRLQLSSEQGATIYWSTDGENYEEYTAEIKIDTTCTIYAYAEIDGVESEVTSETYVVAAEYENIAAMQAAVEATEEGTPVIINLEAIITSVGDKQITIKDNTGEVLVSDNYMPTEYAVRDTLTGKMRGVYKLVKGTPTVCELDYAYLRHKIFVLTEAPKLEGQYFTVGNATSILKEYTWYLLRNVGRNAYVNETDVDLRMLPATSITSMAAADDNLGVLFHLEKSENGEDLYTICSGKGNYFTIAQSSSAISATAVDYLVKNISGNTFYMQDPTSNVVVDGNAAGGTFVGWGTTVPTSTGGNNAYQFMEVEFVDAAKAASIVKASGILNELQQEYGLVTDASQYSSNAVEPTEGSLAALLDNNYTTFFHSTWSQTVEGTHYLQAEVSKPTQSLFFYFKKRSQNNNNRPTDITILGSNDGVNFTEITTIKSGLPTEASVLDYTSNTIKAKQAYKHFRFMVNATSGDTGNTQFFTFSEFYILPGESAIRNVLTTANALLGANVTDKNFDKLVAAFDAAYAKLKGEDEKPVTPTGKKVVYDLDVERTAGMGYAADEYPIATSELAALLGGNTLENATIWGVNPDGTFVADAMATYDGWRDAQGAFAYWGETAAVCAKLFQEEASYLVELCTFPDNDPVAGTKYTATWALTAGNDTVVINTNITFVAPKELNINSLEVVSTITVEHNENAAVAYSGNTAAFDAAAAAKALGIATLDEADQYILNVTTGNLVVNTTDGWRDANGDAAGWGNAGGVCVKIQVPSSGSVDYIGCYDETHAAGETYTAKWAFVHGSKAVVVEVVITFIDASGIGNIHVDGPITVYTISGQAIQTTMDGMQSLERGIYIVNGKKVVIK